MMPSSKLKTKPKLDLAKTALEFEAIGTLWSIKLNQTLNKQSKANLFKSIKSRIDIFDKNYSRFRDDSLVSLISKQADMYKLPDDARLLFDTYERLYNLTGGLMTPLVGQMLVDSGYDSTYSFEPKDLRPSPSWEEMIDYNYPNLQVKQPCLLDFGAAGKGYLVDIVAEEIKAKGIKSFSINAGGDILNYNLPDNLSFVGLEHPINLDEVIGIAQLNNGSICGSATNRRAWKNYNHVFNPHTMQSVSEVLATWVVSKPALIADALSTALFFVPADLLKADYKFEFALIRQDLSLEYSNNFPARFYS